MYRVTNLLTDLGFGQAAQSSVADGGCASAGSAAQSAPVVCGVAVEGGISCAVSTPRRDKRCRDPASFTSPHARGDSDRCRGIYEEVLQGQLGAAEFRRYRPRAAHLSVGRCRHIAIVHDVELPPFNLLVNAGFNVDAVARYEWVVPDACRRIPRQINKEGRCPEGRCMCCRV